MSAIDDLKNGSAGNMSKTINKISMIDGSPKREVTSTIDIAQAMGIPEKPVDENIDARGYVGALMDVDDPNSMFMQHFNKKVEEAKEWIAAKQEEEVEKEYENKMSKYEEPDEDVEVKDDDDYGVKLDKFEDDLENPAMINKSIDNVNVITMDITGGGNKVEEEEYGVSLDEPEVKEPAGITIDTTEPTEEEINSVTIDVSEGNPVNEVEVPPTTIEVTKAKREEPTEEEYTSDVDIEVNTSHTERKIANDEEPETTTVDEDEEAKKRDENMKRLQKIVAARLKPASLGLDLSSFTVVKSAKVNTNDIYDSYKAKVSKWVAMNQESVIYMREFSGSELELLMEYYNAYTSSIRLARRYDTATVDTRSARQMYNMIYDHLEGSKPANFTTWLKITPISDIDNYFFAIYISSFMGANYIPVDCTECKSSYVTEDLNIMDTMVKFPSQEARDKFTEIYNSNTTPSNKGLYTTEVIPLTNMIAIGFKEPSIDDMISINDLSKDFQEEFSSILTFIPYIDAMYKIDISTKSLIPIDYKKFDSEVKTLRSRIRKYNSLFDSMGVDAFAPVKAYISALDNRTTRGINYVMPETKCPECGHINPEIPIGNGETADMVFTRCQLGALVSTSIN